MLDNRKKLYDDLLILKDNYAVTAAAAACVGGVANYEDTGGGFTSGSFNVDLGTLGTAAGLTANFGVILQGSLNSSFTTNVTLARVDFGQADYIGSAPMTNATALAVQAATVAQYNIAASVGRYSVPFTNMYGDVVYRYLRAYTLVGGATTGTAEFAAFLSN